MRYVVEVQLCTPDYNPLYDDLTPSTLISFATINSFCFVWCFFCVFLLFCFICICFFKRWSKISMGDQFHGLSPPWNQKWDVNAKQAKNFVLFQKSEHECTCSDPSHSSPPMPSAPAWPQVCPNPNRNRAFVSLVILSQYINTGGGSLVALFENLETWKTFVWKFLN